MEVEQENLGQDSLGISAGVRLPDLICRFYRYWFKSASSVILRT
jgi:hypothetical protein